MVSETIVVHRGVTCQVNGQARLFTSQARNAEDVVAV
jgi:hypothetical protein